MIIKQELIRIIGIVWRSLVLASGQLLALVLTGGILNALGAPMPKVEGAAKVLPWFFLSSVLTGLVLGPIAAVMPGSRGRQFFVWGSLLSLNSIVLLFEAAYFAPKMVGEGFPVLLVQQVIASLIGAMVLALLFARPQKNAASSLSKPHRSWQAWAWRFGAASLTYLACYFVFGWLNYHFVTKPYYDAQVAGLTVPSLPEVLGLESVRAPLIVLSVLPFLFSMQTTPRRLAVLTGSILFTLGGAGPLVTQIPTLPLFLLVASGWEVFAQHFTTGVVAALLLAPAPASASTPAPAVEKAYEQVQ